MTDSLSLRVGDICTRDGTDRQRVVEFNDAGDLILVECIRAPLGYLEDDGSRAEPWCKVGDLEWNMARRYEHCGDVVEVDPIRWNEQSQYSLASAQQTGLTAKLQV